MTYGQAKEEKLDPNKVEDWFLQLSDSKKWELLVKFVNDGIDFREALKNSTLDMKTVNLYIEENKKFLKQYKPYYTKWGVGVSGYFLLNYDKINVNISKDLSASIDFYIYFLNGRLFITPSIIIKFYDNIGGGVSFGLGYNF